MERPLLISDFFKEGAFLKERDISDRDPGVPEKPLRIEPDDAAPEGELKEFWKKLRFFFRTGKQAVPVVDSLLPLLPAPYIKAHNWKTDYPYFLGSDQNTGPLESLIQSVFDETFKENPPKILKKNLPRLFHAYKDLVSDKKNPYSFSDLTKKAFLRLEELEVHGEEGKKFKEDLNFFRKSFPQDGTLLAFASDVPVHLLNYQLRQRRLERREFLKKVELKIQKLEELLSITGNNPGNGKKKKGVDQPFEEMISFSKVETMIPGKGSTEMKPSRAERIKKTRDMLIEAEFIFDRKDASVLVSESLKDRFDWDSILDKVVLNFSKLDKVFQKGEECFNSDIRESTRLVAALRIADLELEDRYFEDVHDGFFEHFNWHRFSAEEWDLFAPCILVLNAQEIMEEALGPYTQMLSRNKPLKIWAINEQVIHEPKPEVSWEDASHSFRRELSAITMAHRSTFCFQCTLDQPRSIFHGIKTLLSGFSPGIFHYLIPHQIKSYQDYVSVTSAVEGRFFPCLEYDPNKDVKWGNRYDIHLNPQPDRDWPTYEVKYLDMNEDPQTVSLDFTYADYKALFKEKVAELMLVPERYVQENLIDLPSFLKLPSNELPGKVPFIWLVDGENRIRRAALPYMWVVSCQERLDYWNYIQDLAGINSAHVEQALRREKEKWEKEKEKETQALQELHQKEIEKTRQEAGSQTLDNLVSYLLDMGSGTTLISPAASLSQSKEVESKAEEKTKEEHSPIEKEEKPKSKKVSAEPWVESFKCTSCNDCLDKLPGVFKYNEEKQAYLADASKGTYQEIVEAAEGCPASCIHPGLPKDQNDPGMKEWIKRAEKFN